MEELIVDRNYIYINDERTKIIALKYAVIDFFTYSKNGIFSYLLILSISSGSDFRFP